MYKIVLYEYGKQQTYTVLDIPNSIVNIESGSIDFQEDNVDSLSFSLNHSYIISNGLKLKPFITLAKVYNTKNNKIIFKGRLLVPEDGFDANGKFSHNLVFEGKQAYLHDTTQKYSFEFDKMPVENLSLCINYHNQQIANEPYKKFVIGSCNVPKNVIEQDGEYREEEKYFKRSDDKDTFDTLESDLKGKYDGHFLIEYTEDDTQDKIHYLTEIGSKKMTKIKIGHNLQTFQYKIDPTEIITRLKPLGSSSETANGDEIRLTIADVNNGIEYIDIPELIALYGIQVGAVDFDAYAPITLKERALKWIDEQRKKVAKMSISLDALDLSLIGIDPDELEMYGIYTTEVTQLNVVEDLKIIGLQIDLLNPQNKSITIGEKELSYEEVQTKYYNDVAINVVNNIAPTIVNNAIQTEVTGMIKDAETRLESSIDDKIDDFEELTFNPYKATVSDLMNTKISDFKNYTLGGIIEATIDTNKNEIYNDVVNKINNAPDVLKASALQVDAAMINEIVSSNILTDTLVADSAFIYDVMASQAAIDRIKSTAISTNQLDIYSITNKQGTIPGAITIMRPDGAKLVINGMQQFGLSIWRYHPQFVNTSVNVSGVYFTTTSTDLVTFDAFAFKHDSRFVKIRIEAYTGSSSGYGTLSVEGFGGSNFQRGLTISGNVKQTYELTIDAGIPTGELKYFYLRFSSYSTSYTMYAREIIIFQEG